MLVKNSISLRMFNIKIRHNIIKKVFKNDFKNPLIKNFI